MSERPKELLEAYAEICTEYGAITPVNANYYRYFGNMPDDDMSYLLRVILIDRADQINRWVFAWPRMKTEQDIFDYLDTILYMIALGFVQFTEDDAIGYCQPVGPKPTGEEEAMIDHRIRASRPLYRRTILKLLAEKKRGEV